MPALHKLDYDDNLPIVQRRDEICGLLRKHQVLVVCGETGSGKSTQLPKFCLEIGRRGIIGHTQPRRIAAKSIAARIAHELANPQIAGYEVRFDKRCDDNTIIKLMTDGILLAESQTDKLFRKYDTLIIDEAHERSLNIDFLLGIIKGILPKRHDLKLIITSATIDAQRFAQHFGDAPIIEVSGRAYPIDIRYRPLTGFDDDDVSRETDIQQRAILESVNECCRHGHGDILLFLPTERDILETAKVLRATKNACDILPLYSRLPNNQQQKVFELSKQRRIILATNVAESSLTVPGIRFVIDTGTARISRYNTRTRTQRLPIEAVSQASADQRAGRCGRIGPGVCIRLYSEQDYRHRDRYTMPEIQRTNLAAVILQTLSLKLGSIEHFPFLDPPRGGAIADGFKTLYEIGAVDEHRQLTPVGRKLAKMPVDPRIGRMLLAAQENNCVADMLVVAAAMETQDPRERPPEFAGKADAVHAQFLDVKSDFIGYLKLWDFYQNLKEKTSRSGLRKACQQHFLSYNKLKEWSDVHLQLMREVAAVDKKPDKSPASRYAGLHQSILAGNLSGIAHRDSNTQEYTIANGGKYVLWLGSGLKKPSATGAKSALSDNALPHWVLAAERVETNRKYLRTVAQIDERWIEPLSRHLIRKTYHEPHWNSETGYVHAYEKVSLFGIVLVAKRRINFGKIAPQQARDIFIQNALVEGDLETDCGFFIHNQRVLDEAKKLQDKLRQPDLLKPETVRYRFYQERIPDEVFDQRSLEKFCKTQNTDFLKLTLEDFIDARADSRLFPDKLDALEIKYKYAPGEADDGLTLLVSCETLPKVEPQRLGWLVPGLVEQKITMLLKSLPKDIRRSIVPIPDTVRDLMKRLNFAEGDLEETLCKELTRLAGRIVVRTDFKQDALPRELQMNIRVLDDKGETLKESRDFAALRKEFRPAPVFHAVQNKHPFYEEHRSEIHRQIQHLPNVEKLRIYAQPLFGTAFDGTVGLFIAKRMQETGATAAGVVSEITTLLTAIFENFQETRLALEKNKNEEVQRSIKILTQENFLLTTPWNWLLRYPVYFKAAVAAVASNTHEPQKYWTLYEQRRDLHSAAGIDDPELELFRWMIEEYRVSLYAQKLGTALKVSPQRLDKQFEKVRR